MRILIVDDHILFRQGLIGLLNAEPDIEVCGEAGSLKETIKLSHELKPDMILMDFELPDGTGVEATQEILREHSSCLIIFMTVYGEDDKLISAIRGGAVGYLLKSTPIKELVASIRAVQAGEGVLSPQMTRRLMAELSHSGRTEDGSSDAFARLTRREKEILRELMLKSSNQEIAAKLVIDENTVKHHIHSIFGKLEIHSRREAAEYAKKYGLK